MTKAEKLEWTAVAGIAAAAALLAFLRPLKAIDFRVYWENARHFYGGTGPMYGPASGTGWAGGVYRYPPIFLDLFRPLGLLPLAAGAALWAAGKVIAAGALVIALRRRWLAPSLWSLWPGLLLIAAYMVQEVRYGNAQLYIVVLCMAAFYWAVQQPAGAGAALGIAAAFKIWPLFFFPFLVVMRRWRMALWAVISGVVATVLPVLWRGWQGQLGLLRSWLAQEHSIGELSGRVGELWYPGQSLHDVLMRFLSVIDYSQLPDRGYPQVAWLHWTPAQVEWLWLVVTAVLVGFGFFWAARHGEAQWDAMAGLLFCGVVVVEPHVHRLILVTLLWPALWLAAAWERGQLTGWSRHLWWLAVAAAVAGPLIPGAARQRIWQAYGMDFWLVVLPLTVLMARATASECAAVSARSSN